MWLLACLSACCRTEHPSWKGGWSAYALPFSLNPNSVWTFNWSAYWSWFGPLSSSALVSRQHILALDTQLGGDGMEFTQEQKDYVSCIIKKKNWNVAGKVTQKHIGHTIFTHKWPELWDYNQYWYSAETTAMMRKEIEELATKAAFLSVPSVYFSLEKRALRDKSHFFDIDERWKGFPGFVKWNFNEPDEIPSSHLHQYDYVVIDPPYISKDTWEKYSEAALLLLKPKGKILLSTIAENDKMLKKILNVDRVLYLPSIPSLTYQYAFFTNYPTKYLNEPNPELSTINGPRGYPSKLEMIDP